MSAAPRAHHADEALVAHHRGARATGGAARVEERRHRGSELPRRASARRCAARSWCRCRARAARARWRSVAWLGYVAEVITARAWPGARASRVGQRGEHRRVPLAHVARRQRVEHGEHDLHTGRPSKSPINDTSARSPGCRRRERVGLRRVVLGPPVALARCVVRGVQRAPRARRAVGSAAVRGAAVEPERGARRVPTPAPTSSDACDRPVDTTPVVHGEHAVEAARHHLEPAVVGVGVVDRDHRRHVVGDQRVRGRVLVRRVPRAAGQLVVDLLLVEHRRFAEQRARRRRASGRS